VTPSPTPSATPTVVPDSWPGPGNTGVPAGTNLRLLKAGDSGNGWRVENGVLYVTQSGITLDSLDIPFVVKVMANNVSITRSRIRASGWYTINVSDPPMYYTGLKLTDVEIDGLGSSSSTPGIAVMGNEGAVYTRLNVHGFGSSGPRISGGTTLQDSWIHDFVCPSGSGWHSAGASANEGGGNIHILRNRIDINTANGGCASAAFALYPADGGPFDGVDVIGNYLDGGAYCLYTGQNQPGVKNVHVENNRFGRTYFSTCGRYGPVAQAATVNGNTFTGNAYVDGTPIT
jgi:hypothetical protein